MIQYANSLTSYTIFGLSTDTKPLTPPVNSIFIEIDTGNCYTSDGTNWIAQPIPTAQQTALAAKQATLVSTINIKTINGVSILGSGDLIIGGAVAWGAITGTLANQTDLNNALALKAPLDSPTFTGVVAGITATMVGLGNVNNTSDASKPVSTAQQTALDLKANLASPTLVTPILGVATVTSINGLIFTALATGFTIAGGTVSKTLTVPLDASISGTNTGDNAVNSLYSGLVSNANHSGDATGATALTLATVNGNVGSFGTATQVATFTVNAKGLITAVANTAIQIAESQVTNLTTDLGLKAPLASPTFTGTVAGITATMVGLGNVTNESKATMFTNAVFTGTFAVAAGSIANAALANGAVANLSGTNTGDNAVNSLYSGLVSNANHTGDATGATALTLATVNGNVGSFGSATQVPVFTVNAKGLITAVANTAIQIAESQVTNLTTDLGLKAPLASPTFTGTVTLPANTSLTTPVIGAATGTSLALTGNMSTSAGNIGYAVGAGGAVTQITSKATGVTINKICGAITTTNAALAAGSEVKFTVTNSTVAATDVIALSVKSGGTSGSYLLTVGAVAAGSFDIVISNASAGSLSEALVINFAVIKAVAS